MPIACCKISFIATGALLSFAGAEVSTQKDQPKYAWSPSPVPQREATIECDLTIVGSDTVKLGEQFTIGYRIRVVGAATDIYNPFLDRRLPSAVTLAVFDGDKRFLGDLFISAADVRSETSAGPRDWIFARHRNSVGAEVKVYSKEPNLREPPPSVVPITKPGSYHLQLIFSERVVSGRGDEFPKEAWEHFYRGWLNRAFREDYCRSNVIKLVVE